eukprot:1161194-Pelagomonas_calceolata.AAC.1
MLALLVLNADVIAKHWAIEARNRVADTGIPSTGPGVNFFLKILYLCALSRTGPGVNFFLKILYLCALSQDDHIDPSQIPSIPRVRLHFTTDIPIERGTIRVDTLSLRSFALAPCWRARL